MDMNPMGFHYSARESSGLARLHWIRQGACFGISPFSSTECEYIYSSELSFMLLQVLDSVYVIWCPRAGPVLRYVNYSSFPSLIQHNSIQACRSKEHRKQVQRWYRFEIHRNLWHPFRHNHES